MCLFRNIKQYLEKCCGEGIRMNKISGDTVNLKQIVANCQSTALFFGSYNKRGLQNFLVIEADENTLYQDVNI